MAGFKWREIRVAAKHHLMHRTAVHNTVLSGPKCQDPRVGSPVLKETDREIRMDHFCMGYRDELLTSLDRLPPASYFVHKFPTPAATAPQLLCSDSQTIF